MPDGWLEPGPNHGNVTGPSPSSGSGIDIGPILRKFHIPWPEGDENAARTAAADWSRLAEAIRDNYGPANSAAESLMYNQAGAAIDAFEQYWSRYGGGNKGALLLGAQACDNMAELCNNYAADISSVKSKIEQAVLEVGGGILVGTIAAFVTFGATEAIADAFAAEVATSAAAWIAEVGSGWVFEIGDTLASLVEGISEVAGDAVADASQGLASTLAGVGDFSTFGSVLGTGIAGTAGGLASTLLTAPFQGPVSQSELAKELLVSGLTGGTGSSLGELGELSAPQLSNLLSNAAEGVMTRDPQAYVSLMELSKQVDGMTGKVTNSVLSSIASQLIVARHIDAQGFTSDQLVSLLSGLTAAPESGG